MLLVDATVGSVKTAHEGINISPDGNCWWFNINCCWFNGNFSDRVTAPGGRPSGIFTDRGRAAGGRPSGRRREGGGGGVTVKSLNNYLCSTFLAGPANIFTLT